MVTKACTSTRVRTEVSESEPAVSKGRCFSDAGQAVRDGARRGEPAGAHSGGISVDVDVDPLRRQLETAGNLEEDVVYGYVVATVRPVQGQFQQRGSGPNWQAGLITLCTCKHSMRAMLTPEEWRRGKWVAGLTGWNSAFAHQQSLVYLMRVGEAYSSHAELVQQLRQTGRSAALAAKDASQNPLGDVMTPSRAGMPLHPYDPGAYRVPVLGHAHRQTENATDWHDDIDYGNQWDNRPALLVGDPEQSFLWTRPMVRRKEPGYTRPYRKWPFADFLDDLEDVPA